MEESDVHMEADIRALDINPNGFAEGDWIPYLKVSYEVTKQGSNEKSFRRLYADGCQRRPALRR